MFIPVGKRMLVDKVARGDVPGLEAWKVSILEAVDGSKFAPDDPFEYGRIAVLSTETKENWDIGQVVIYSASGHRPEIGGQTLLPAGDILVVAE